MNSIIKQDINFLDKPLWFQDVRQDGLGSVWKDIDGYEYRTGYKLPDKVDMLILLCLIYKSQQIGYSREIQATRYEILKKCGFPTTDTKYYERLEDSLKRWNNIAIEFRGTFYDGKRYLAIGFGIIEDYEINEETNLIVITFNEKWLLKIKESEYYKYLNFEYYKALKRPLSRRLFEVLCKNFKGRIEWSIGLVKLGAKLTLSGRTVGKKGQEKQVIYASDVLVAVKPAINEINRMSTSDEAATMGIHPDDLFTLDYTITGKGQDRVINFIKILVTSATTTPSPSESPDQATIKMLIGLVPPEHREKKTIQEAITQHLRKHGQEYVKRNIEYANATHKINYRAYLDKSLKSDWGFSDQEDGLTPEVKKFMGMAVDCWEQFKGNCAGFRGASKAIMPTCKYCPGKKALPRKPPGNLDNP